MLAGDTAAATVGLRADGTIAGMPVAEAAFRLYDPSLRFTALVADGDGVAAGTELARIEGPARSLLTAERTALNLLGRLSGIATATATMVELVAGTGASIVCTRKTTPGLRALEKYAVRMGGGSNHRFGLYDAVLIKDNHVAVAGGVGRGRPAGRRPGRAPGQGRGRGRFAGAARRGAGPRARRRGAARQLLAR